jgi:2-polyprenyl-6-hydroxyphenyl methylase/3-demethylubiquinone-9 3-methyltransferase
MSEAHADPAEIAKFASLADQWWDPRGAFKTLHDINPLRVDYLQSRIPLEGCRVLDVGCGGGLLCEALAALGANVSGLDLAEENLIAARQHAAQTGLSIEYLNADVAELAERQAATFDVVTCLEVLEHAAKPETVLGACARIVRPGGSVFFSTINRNLKSFLLAIVGAEYVLRMVPKGTHEYAKLVRPSEVARWCRRAGLLVKDFSGLHYNPLTRTYRLGGNVDVNYFGHAQRPGPAT